MSSGATKQPGSDNGASWILKTAPRAAAHDIRHGTGAIRPNENTKETKTDERICEQWSRTVQDYTMPQVIYVKSNSLGNLMRDFKLISDKQMYYVLFIFMDGYSIII